MIDRIVNAATGGVLGAVAAAALTLFCLGGPDRIRRRELARAVREERARRSEELEQARACREAMRRPAIHDPGDQVP